MSGMIYVCDSSRRPQAETHARHIAKGIGKGGIFRHAVRR